MTMESNFTPPEIWPRVVREYDENQVQVRRLGHTSCDYRRSHIEVWIEPLGAGEAVLNIPMMADGQGTIRAIRVRSKSEKIKITLTPTPSYDPNKDIHPRAIIYQQTYEERDTIEDFENLYVYYDDNNNGSPIKTYLSVENEGADSEGVSVIFTFGY